jgi:hypothetical protein
MFKLPKSIAKWRKRRLRKSIPESQNIPRSIAVFVSYPKSGRTWLRVIFDELGVTLKYTHDGMGVSKLRPFKKRNHCTRSSYQNKPVVFLTRDPRDTVVSAYFHTKLRVGNFTGDISQFIRDPLHGIEKILLYNLTWLERGPDLPAFLPITYEETSDNSFAVVRKIADFLGVGLADSDIKRVVANNTFENMHKRESGDEYRQRYEWEISPGNPNEPESYKVRRGKVGGFVDYLSVEDIVYCNKILSHYRYFESVEERLR